MRLRKFLRVVREEAAAPECDETPEPMEPGVYICPPGKGCGYAFFRVGSSNSPLRKWWFGPIIDGSSEYARWRTWEEIDQSYIDCAPALVLLYRHLFELYASR
jgi:hypothetical protein